MDYRLILDGDGSSCVRDGDLGIDFCLEFFDSGFEGIDFIGEVQGVDQIEGMILDIGFAGSFDIFDACGLILGAEKPVDIGIGSISKLFTVFAGDFHVAGVELACHAIKQEFQIFHAGSLHFDGFSDGIFPTGDIHLGAGIGDGQRIADCCAAGDERIDGFIFRADIAGKILDGFAIDLGIGMFIGGAEDAAVDLLVKTLIEHLKFGESFMNGHGFSDHVVFPFRLRRNGGFEVVGVLFADLV